jgi:hypothetical protein
MRGLHWRALVIVAAVAASGCQSGPSKQTLAAAEPALSPPVEGGTVAAAPAPAPPPRSVTFVDRHPLLYKPRDYYESAGSNTVVKTGAAVLVGVPVGIVTELKQIVVGAPPAPAY